MENSMLYQLPFDPLYLVLGFSALSFVLLIAFIVCVVKMNKLYRRYDRFMRGKDAESLEDTMNEILDQLKDLNMKDRANKDMMKVLSKQVGDSFQKFGFVKYNAFKGMGGNLSFVLAMLDDHNSGFVLDVVHSREGCYMYLKEVEEGATETLLGSEEQEALEQALGYVKRPTLSERLDKKKKGSKKEKAGSGEQSIEIPNSERIKSERMKELRRLQRESMEAEAEAEEAASVEIGEENILASNTDADKKDTFVGNIEVDIASDVSEEQDFIRTETNSDDTKEIDEGINENDQPDSDHKVTRLAQYGRLNDGPIYFDDSDSEGK